MKHLGCLYFSYSYKNHYHLAKPNGGSVVLRLIYESDTMIMTVLKGIWYENDMTEWIIRNL